MGEIIFAAVFAVGIAALLVAVFFFDAPSEDEQTAVAIRRADDLIAELEATDALIRRVRLDLADGLEGHAAATITILEVAGQLGDAVANLEAARRLIAAGELGVDR